MRFHKLEIYSYEGWWAKQIFRWEFKDINFLCFGNNGWKTTFFHIMKDIMGNPNVAWQWTTWKSIFTQDLLTKNLETVLEFSVNNRDFKTIKRYIPKNSQSFFDPNGNIYASSIEDFIIRLEKEKVITLPKVVYNNKHVLTFNSIMRLCFIASGHFSNKITLKNNETINIIVKHNNDGFAKILFYWYVLWVLNTDDLLSKYYSIAWNYSKVVNELNEIDTKIKLITKHDIQNWGLFFNDSQILIEIGKAQNKLRQLSLDNLNYESIVSELKDIHYSNAKVSDINDYDQSFLWLIANDIKMIENKITENESKIEQARRFIETQQKELKKIDDFLVQHYLRELQSLDKQEDKQLLSSLNQQKEIKKIIKKEVSEEYDYMVNKIKKDEWFNILNKILQQSLDFLGWVNVNLIPEDGIYSTTTTADSINRIILFNIILSFLYMKIEFSVNHPNFVFYDSPFTGLNKELELNALSSFIKKHINSKSLWQVFISLNPDEIDISSIVVDNNKDYISIKQWDRLLEF